mgnify:CR=1 FL=1
MDKNLLFGEEGDGQFVAGRFPFATRPDGIEFIGPRPEFPLELPVTAAFSPLPTGTENLGYLGGVHGGAELGHLVDERTEPRGQRAQRGSMS